MINKQPINTASAPAAIGPYSQAILVDHTLYCSGQIPLDPATGQLLTSDITSQTHQIFKNIEKIIQSAHPNATLQNIIKTTIFLTDLSNFQAVNEGYSEIFQPPYPARSTVQVAALPKNAQIEIEVIAQN